MVTLAALKIESCSIPDPKFLNTAALKSELNHYLIIGSGRSGSYITLSTIPYNLTNLAAAFDDIKLSLECTGRIEPGIANPSGRRPVFHLLIVEEEIDQDADVTDRVMEMFPLARLATHDLNETKEADNNDTEDDDNE
ncbi:hypothetical protein GX51_00490 [Blastomyces parvus]|uniref:Uncharacterized protein n=1 Tax=Blastomyces parvus TaxID=2060905 RepID=A0A2B7XLX7_9EURO|nr:hypothetical protein GX51_00490 [Blastomyces parvus]